MFGWFWNVYRPPDPPKRWVGTLPHQDLGAGTGRVTERLRALGLALGFGARQVCVAPRLLGATLLLVAPLSGTLRVAPRVTGNATAPILNAPQIAGTLRSTQRLRALGISLRVSAAPLRSASRLTGALGFSTKVLVSGTARSAERLRALGMALKVSSRPIRVAPRLIFREGGVPPTTAVQAGRLRAPSGRVRSTSFTLVHDAAQVRSVERLRGQASVSAPPGATSLVRVAPRLLHAELTLVYPAAEVVAAPRLTGLLRLVVPLRGTVRSSERARASMQVGVASLTGRIRVVERLRGDASVVVAVVQGRVRVVERLTARLFPGPSASLAGRVRVVERITGLLRVPFSLALELDDRSRVRYAATDASGARFALVDLSAPRTSLQ